MKPNPIKGTDNAHNINKINFFWHDVQNNTVD